MSLLENSEDGFLVDDCVLLLVELHLLAAEGRHEDTLADLEGHWDVLSIDNGARTDSEDDSLVCLLLGTLGDVE